jgi:hypothetical protein
MNPHNSLSTALPPDLLALQARVARRREYMELLEVELSNTRAVIMEFTQVYSARIGPLENRHRQLQELLEKLTADFAPPDTEWKGRKGGQQQKAQNGHKNEEPKPKPKKAKPAETDPNYERKVRDLFHRLAKQHHPDLAQAEEDKKRRVAIMAEINLAYSDKNLEALENLEKDHQLASGALWSGPEADLARLTMELRQLDTMIFEVEQLIRELDLSPAMQMRSSMKADRETGRDYFRDLEADYRSRIIDLQEQLIALGADLDISNSVN